MQKILVKDKKGNAQLFIEVIIGLVIALSLFPIIKSVISGMISPNATLTGTGGNFSSIELTIITIVPLLLIIGILYFVYYKTMKK